MFGPDGTSFIDKDDVTVRVSDHNAYRTSRTCRKPTAWSVINRPKIQPVVTCLGASAIEPLNTYKAGFGYKIPQGYTPPVRPLSGSPIPTRTISTVT